MVEINLLNSVPKVRGVASRNDGTKKLGIFIAILLFVTITGVITARALILVGSSISKKTVSVAGMVSSNKSLENSREIKDSIEPISSLDKSSTVPSIMLSYNEMTPLEKINYEMKMPMIVFKKLSEGVPSSVDFTHIIVDNFTTVKGSGVVTSKGDAAKMLKFFKESGWRLAPKPETIIFKVNSYYKFRFRTDYSLSNRELQDIVIKDSDIPSINSLSGIRQNILKIASDNGIILAGELGLINSSLGDNYNNYEYKLSGNCSYPVFRLFLASIYKSGSPIRFSKIELNASGTSVEFNVNLLITAI